MIRFFIPPLFDKSGVLPFLTPFFHSENRGSNLYVKNRSEEYFYKDIIRVDSIPESDFVIFPQGIRKYKGKHKKYIDLYIKKADRYKKKAIVFTAGDLHHKVFIPRAIVFKALNYRRLKRENEIYTPVYVEDLLKSRKGLSVRTKDHSIPVVGFCGWADLAGFREKFIYQLKNIAIDVSKLIMRNQNLEVFKKGIYFRRKALCILRESSLVVSNFIVRPSYSGNIKTISLSAERARKEFIQNILDSDFVLAPKGDGNSSARFYEILSLGRIPILIDTDMILPLEEVIDYSKFAIRIPYQKLEELPWIVSNFYKSISSEEFENMQRAAREAFETYLRYDSFFNWVFSRLSQGQLPESFLGG